MLTVDEGDCASFPGLRHYDNLPLPPSEMKDYNANQGSCNRTGTNDFGKEDCQGNNSMMMKDQGRPLGLHGRQENGLPNKSKLDASENWEKDSLKNHIASSVKGEDYS